MHILLIEDNPGDRRLLQECLREAGQFKCRLSWAERLSDGLARAGAGDVELILLDLSLPDSVGLETLVRVHTLVPRVPIVVLTSREDEALGLELVQAGAQDYLTKAQLSPPLLVRSLRYAVERCRAEQALARLGHQYQLLLESAGEGIYGMDLDGRATVVNPTAAALTGYAPEELIGQEMHELLHHRYPDGRPYPVEACQIMAAFQDDQVHRVTNEVFWRKDGSCFPVEYTATPIREDGRIVGAVVTFRDVTERRRAEERLQLYREIFANSIDAIVVLDAEGRYLEQNRAHEQLLGYSIDDLRGHTPAVHLGGAEFQRAWSQLKAHGEFHGEMSSRTKDGGCKTVELSGFSVRNASGVPIRYIGIKRDVTERKRAEERLQRSHEQLRDLASHLQSVREEERTRIAREIHDELGQALTGLKLDMSWLRDRMVGANAGWTQRVEAMYSLVDETMQAVRKIATELRPVVLDQLGLLPAIEWQAREFQVRTGIHCQVNFLLRCVTLAPDRATAVFRIFQEILTNVARHARATRVLVTAKEQAGHLVLEVADNGRGITESELSDSKSLGLLGMRERALLLGGETRIIGAHGKGTTVTVRIPLLERRDRKGEE